MALLLAGGNTVLGQELEPRTSSATPARLHFLALGYSYSSGNVLMDPTLPIEGLGTIVDIVLVR